MTSNAKVQLKLDSMYRELADSYHTHGFDEPMPAVFATVAITADNCPCCQSSGLLDFPLNEGLCWRHMHFKYAKVSEFVSSFKPEGKIPVMVSDCSVNFVPSMFVVSPYRSKQWSRQEWGESAHELAIMCKAFGREEEQTYSDTHQNAMSLLLLQKFGFVTTEDHRTAVTVPKQKLAHSQLKEAEASFGKLTKSRAVYERALNPSMRSLLHASMRNLLHANISEKAVVIGNFKDQLKHSHRCVLPQELGFASDLWEDVYEHCRAYVDACFKVVAKTVSEHKKLSAQVGACLEHCTIKKRRSSTRYEVTQGPCDAQCGL